MDLDAIIAEQKAKDIVGHFSKPFAEQIMQDIEEEAKADAPPNALDFAALSEAMCAEIAEAQENADMWAERLKGLKDQAKRLAGKERGALRYGDYILEVKESKGRSSTDWKAYVTATMTAKAVEEAQADPVYTKQGEPVISLSVKKLGGAK
jgi:hypothetical protein